MNPLKRVATLTPTGPVIQASPSTMGKVEHNAVEADTADVDADDDIVVGAGIQLDNACWAWLRNVLGGPLESDSSVV